MDMNCCEVQWKDREKSRELLMMDIGLGVSKTCCTTAPKCRESWEDQMFERLRSLNIYFVLTKLGGALDFPCHTFRGTTSRTFKAYAVVLCVISLAFTIQSLIYFFLPSLVPRTYIILTNGSGQFARYAVPVWSSATTILRIGLIRVLLDEEFSKNIRQVLWDITNDTHLKHRGIPSRQLPVYLGVFSALPIILFCSFLVTASARYNMSIRDPVFYLLSCEIFLYHSSFEVIAWYLGWLTFKYILPLLEITNSRFSQAAETVNARLLEEAIACHDKCLDLIKCTDRVGGYFMGVCLTVAVPSTVITVSYLGTVSRELESFYPIMLWTICFFGSIAFLTYVAGSIHTAAHLPDEVLTRKVYTCSVFKDNATQFRARFANRSIGYTYFGFATFRKETLLTLLNLVATYVVVGYQLRSNNPHKPPSSEAPIIQDSRNCATAQP